MSSATTAGREPIVIVEIEQDRCGRTFGTAPCAATGEPCYNTYATCKSANNYMLGTPLTLRFCQNNMGQSYNDHYLIPLLDEVNTTPTRLNPAGATEDATAFGERASVDVALSDAPHSDNAVDPYLSSRAFNPLTRSTFWRKWLQRNPYHAGRALRVREGYLGQSWADMRLRHYIIDSIALSNDGVSVKAKDPLTLTDESVSVAPTPTGAALFGDMTDSQLNCTIFGAELADIPVSGWVRVGEEIIYYASRSLPDGNGRITLSGMTRATHGTTGESHSDKDTVQVCLNYQSWLPWRVVQNLLIDYAKIPASYIDSAEWNAEGNDWLSQFTVSCIISEPTGVGKLIAEICRQVLMYVWYDDVVKKIRLRAIRPHDDMSIPQLTDDDHFIADSTSIEVDDSNRATQVWVHHRQRNAAESATEAKNYDAHYIRVDTSAESAFEHGGVRIVHIYARWLESDAQVRSIASRYLARYRRTPVKLRAKLDAKDRDAVSAGSVVDVQSAFIVDSSGSIRTQRFEILSTEDEACDIVSVEMQTAAYDSAVVQKNAYIVSASYPNYADASAAQKNKGCWIANSQGKLPNGDDAYCII